MTKTLNSVLSNAPLTFLAEHPLFPKNRQSIRSRNVKKSIKSNQEECSVSLRKALRAEREALAQRIVNIPMFFSTKRKSNVLNYFI